MRDRSALRLQYHGPTTACTWARAAPFVRRRGGREVARARTDTRPRTASSASRGRVEQRAARRHRERGLLLERQRATLEGVLCTDDEYPMLIASAVRYGFHGTLKAPFRLAAGRSEAQRARQRVAEKRR